MLASMSSSSSTLIADASGQGLKHLYRTLLQQARLLSFTLDDPVLYSSHRHLARKNLQPLLTTRCSLEVLKTWPPSTPAKRLARARVHRRQLADANFGWEHAVHRALSLAYARTGKLRRDALSDLSPQPSTDEKEQKYEKRLRKKEFSPVLQALLMNSLSMDGVPVRQVEHLTERPPPPFLPPEDDPLVQYFGKAKSRNRLSNARSKFVKTYLSKIKLPLDAIVVRQGEPQTDFSMFAHLESKACPSAEHVSNIPKRFRHRIDSEKVEATDTAPSASDLQRQELSSLRPYLAKAREQIELYRSNMDASNHRKSSLRIHGWTSHPKDYSRLRMQRRMYGRILGDTPLLLIQSSAKNDQDAPESEEKLKETKVANDPLGIRAKLRRAHEHVLTATTKSKITVLKSRYSVGHDSNGRSGDVLRGLFPESEITRKDRKDPSKWLNQSEVDFLRSQSVL